jgi:hypothetical protein
MMAVHLIPHAQVYELIKLGTNLKIITVIGFRMTGRT